LFLGISAINKKSHKARVNFRDWPLIHRSTHRAEGSYTKDPYKSITKEV